MKEKKKLKKFRMIADVVFLAEDIDDALVRLSEHFSKAGEGEPGEYSLIQEGKIRICRSCSLGK